MSRWRPDRIRIALHRDRAALIRWSGRGRAPVASQLLALPEAATPQQVGEALGDALGQDGWRHGAIEVVLSHALCRLALVPGGIDVRGEEEEDALHRNCVEEANGELPSGWRLSVAEAPAHLPRPVCAMDGALIEALDTAAASAGGHIVSLRPLLVDACNARQVELQQGRCWFVVVERERACLLRLLDGVWCNLRVKRLFGETEAELATLLRQERLASRIAVVDCDVHQGNGTAAIFRDDPSVFTFSIHGARNYPFRKEASDLDAALEDDASDDEYLPILERHLAFVAEHHRPDFVFYLAGADPYEGDRLGRSRARVTAAGLEERGGARDEAVFLEAAAAKIRVGEAAGEGAAIAHQVFGAIGFTREHTLHRFTQRLWAWRDDFGNESYWAVRLGNAVAAKGADGLWPMLAAR